MKTYAIKRMETPDFAHVELVTLTQQPWTGPCDVQARAGLCLCGDRLYVHMEADEAEIIANRTEPLDSICHDSCLEFFLAPRADDKRYLNIEWNPIRNLYLGFGAERATRVRQICEDRFAIFRPSVTRTSAGWSIDYSIPESFIAVYWPGFRFGEPMACNFYKCADDASRKHYLAWNDLTSVNADFHRREDFGTLIIV